MRDIPFISEEHIDKLLTWSEITDALFSVHQRPEADINDILLQSKNSSLLSRAAWVENFGIAVKTATIFPDNATKFQDLPTDAITDKALQQYIDNTDQEDSNSEVVKTPMKTEDTNEFDEDGPIEQSINTRVKFFS